MNLDKHETIWTSYDLFEQVWTIMDNFKQIWTGLDQCWTSLNPFGQVRYNKREKKEWNVKYFEKNKETLVSFRTGQTSPTVKNRYPCTPQGLMLNQSMKKVWGVLVYQKKAGSNSFWHPIGGPLGPPSGHPTTIFLPTHKWLV